MYKRLLTFAFALCVSFLPLMAIVNGRTLPKMLKELHTELWTAYSQRADAQQRFKEDYDRQHQKMIDIISNTDELAIVLYTQEREMTFDLTYALKKASANYKDFGNDKMPYDRIVKNLDYEIDRYSRLLEALRRIPPIKTTDGAKGVVRHHDDSTGVSTSGKASALEEEVIRLATINNNTVSSPIALDKEGEIYRDSCMLYASRLMKMHADNRQKMVADSAHYQAVYQRITKAYKYAESRYQELERYVFYEGQTPFVDILSDPGFYWELTKKDLKDQYDFEELAGDDNASEEETEEYFNNISSKGENALLVIGCAFQLFLLCIFWILAIVVLWLIGRIFKPKRYVPQNKLPLFSVLVGTILYFLLFGFVWKGDEYFQLGVKNINTFLWLLIAISSSLLLRVQPEQFRYSIQLYSPTFLVVMVIIICRITFTPDKLMNLLFPPILFLVVLRQLFYCFRLRDKTSSTDRTIGCVSAGIYFIAFGYSFFGFTFVSLLILVWWYFLLAAWLTIVCIADLSNRYRARWIDRRVEIMRKSITYVSGEDRESLLFGATWLYDLVREVAIPTMVLLSIPICVRMSLGIFDFDDLFVKLYSNPFVHLVDSNGVESIRISCQSIIHLLILFFVLRYSSKAILTIWRYASYTSFMRKHNRTKIRLNEINLSLGNSIITAMIWMGYAIVIIYTWHIPTSSMGLVAGGLSAGIGLALKDTINNFIYGILLMGGRLRVGDWIECDGVRGQVTSINYQCVEIETIEGTEISFLNSTLFGKNYTSLTHNNSYELTKITFGLPYKTEIDNVREVLVKAMQKMRTKDAYGREIVDPKYAVYVVVENIDNNTVEVTVKQYVLVAERVSYVDRAKEVIYDALTNAGFDVASPQYNIRVSNES